jgi:hypothetical protein
LHCIKSPDQRSLITSLKVIISPLSKIKSESKLFMIQFYSNPLNSARGLYSNGHNHCCGYYVRMSRRWKAELVAHIILLQPSPRIAYLMLLKHDHSPVCPVCPESVQHITLTLKSRSYKTMHQNGTYE